MKSMKRWILVFMAVCLLLCGAPALANERQTFVYSGMYGYTQLAGHVDDYGGYVTVDGFGGVSPAQDMQVTVISKNASVWAEPRTGSKKLGSVGHGTTLLCCSIDGFSTVWRENGFYKVEFEGGIGWINEDYVVLDELTITLLESNVPAYIAPDVRSKKVGSLSKLTTYRVIGFYGEFYIINLRDAAAAYVPMSVLHRDNTFDRNYRGGGGMRAQVVTQEKVSVRTGPGREYPELREMKAGTKLTVWDTIDGWYMISDDEYHTWAFIAPDSLEIRY